MKKIILTALIGTSLILAGCAQQTPLQNQNTEQPALNQNTNSADSEIDQIKSRCSLEPQSGNCKAYMPKYYFDQNENACKEFVWGGCNGVVPFETLVECQNACENKAAMANPASTNCLEKGGTIDIRKNKNGEYGVCLFEDNRQCEEWALLHGECPSNGAKITGLENEAEIYCVITGGQLQGLDTETPMCKRIDGTLCNAQANLDGDCPNPHDPNPSAGNVEAL